MVLYDANYYYMNIRAIQQALDTRFRGSIIKYGYTIQKSQGRVTGITIHRPGPDLEVPLKGKRDAAGLRKVLIEMQRMATLFGLWKESVIPSWVPQDAIEEIMSAPFNGTIKKTFGNRCKIKGEDPKHLPKEVLVLMGGGYLYIHRFWPSDRNKYRDESSYKAAISSNAKMYYYVFTKNLNPGRAMEKLIQYNKDLLVDIMLAMAGWPDKSTLLYKQKRVPKSDEDRILDGVTGGASTTFEIVKEIGRGLKR